MQFLHELLAGEVMAQRKGAPKTKSRKQVGLLLSKRSPLTGAQQAKLKRELHSGAVKVRGSAKRGQNRSKR